jgi:RNA polymerase sigma-70 factor (ECF subfamily)
MELADAQRDPHLAGILAGDAQAFGHWIASVEGALRGSLRGFAGQVDVEAVLQETFLRVWQVSARFRQDDRPNGLLRLAIRIGRNLAISEVRRARTRPVDPVDFERSSVGRSEAPSPSLPDPKLRAIIMTCRERLPLKPRQALDARLSSAGGQSDATIAEALGMTKNTFLQNFTRARKWLAKCLGEHGVDIQTELS